MQKYIDIIKHYLKEFVVLYHTMLLGFFNIIKHFIIFIFFCFNILSYKDKIFIFSLISMLIFLGNGWLTYTIVLSKDYKYEHVIYSDDFLLFLIAIIICFFSIIFQNTNKISYKTSLLLRIIAISIIIIFWCLSWLSPQRISLTQDAEFTYSFFCFIYCTILALISGSIGAITYAHRD